MSADAIAITDGTYRFTSPGSESMEIELKAGQAMYMDTVEHETEFSDLVRARLSSWN